MTIKIKFDYADGGGIEYSNSGSAFASIFAIGALLHTRFYSLEEDSPHLQFKTDGAGLKQGVSCADESIEFINRSVSALGKAIVYVDRAEIDDEVESIAWLISALSDLARDIQFARDEMDSALGYLRGGE